MKNRRKSILETIRETDGAYRYTGESFRIRKTEDPKGNALAGLTICIILSALLVIISGTIDTEAAFGVFYVILPYVGEVSALFMLVWNYIRLIYNRNQMRAYVKDHVSSRIPGAAAALSLCALLGLILSALYLFLHGSGGQLTASVLYLACQAGTAISAFACRKAYRRLAWERV